MEAAFRKLSSVPSAFQDALIPYPALVFYVRQPDILPFQEIPKTVFIPGYGFASQLIHDPLNGMGD